MWIGGQDLLAECRLHPPIDGFLLAKLLEAAAGADRIDVPLGKNGAKPGFQRTDRKSTRLNSSHDQISYAVFCLKKKQTVYMKYADAGLFVQRRPYGGATQHTQ